jgi:hypothetical protein
MTRRKPEPMLTVLTRDEPLNDGRLSPRVLWGLTESGEFVMMERCHPMDLGAEINADSGDWELRW